jgi:hypothetical protein
VFYGGEWHTVPETKGKIQVNGDSFVEKNRDRLRSFVLSPWGKNAKKLQMLGNVPTESTSIRLTIASEKIAWLKFLVEGYEGTAVVTTIDSSEGRVLLLVGPGAEQEIATLVLAVGPEIGLVEGLSDELAVFIPER